MPAQTMFNKLRMLSGLLLLVSVILPLYAVRTSWGGSMQSMYLWDVGRGDFAGALFLVLAYAAPSMIVLVHRRALSRMGSAVLSLSEPLALGLSVTILLTIVGSAFTLLPLFGPWMLVPASASMGVGAWLALVADGMLLLLWIASAGWRLRHAAIGPAIT